MNLQVNRKRRETHIDVYDSTFERIRSEHSIVAHEMLNAATAGLVGLPPRANINAATGGPVYSLRQKSETGGNESSGNSCSIGEVAFEGKEDPLEMRRRLMAPHLVARNLLEVVAVMSDWQTPLPRGKARGLAFVHAFGTWMAEVVQISQHQDGIRIDKVFCAADAGLVLDERNFRSRIISSVVSELSLAIGRRIADDDVADRDAYTRPEIEVEMLANSERRSGGGRPAVPPVAPALANAVFALTGQRVHHQPLFDAVTFV